MKENVNRTKAPTVKPPGLHNDFSEQEESMTASAMPPAFALTASAAQGGNAANGNAAMDSNLTVAGVPVKLLQLLMDREGIKWSVYRDSEGHLTAGLGHKLTESELARMRKGDPVSISQVQSWAIQDVGRAWTAAQSQMTEIGLNDNEFCVYLASVNFQLGPYWNTKHLKTWALMQEHKWLAAAEEAADSKWQRQTPTRVADFQKGLRELAMRVSDTMQQGLAHGKAGKSQPKTMGKIEQPAATSSPVTSRATDLFGEGPTGSEGEALEHEKAERNPEVDGISWIWGPVIGKDSYYSQIHPSKGGDRPIPRSVAFSGALAKYERGGASDIYDDAKCKASWVKLSHTEREAKVYNFACKNTCDYILGGAGYAGGGSNDTIYSLTETTLPDNSKRNDLASTAPKAMNRLDGYLAAGMPVVIGVDYKFKGANPGSPTDHFVIVVGKGQDDKGMFYVYMDVGRTMMKDGTDYGKNRLYVGMGKNGAAEEGWVSGKKPNGAAYYSISEVRSVRKK